RQGDERVHHVVVLLGQVAPLGERRLARERDVGMLGRPQRLEPPRLERPPEGRRPHRVVGEEDRRSEVHRRLRGGVVSARPPRTRGDGGSPPPAAWGGGGRGCGRGWRGGARTGSPTPGGRPPATRGDSRTGAG